VLRPGGAVGIAVNTRTCPREEALALLAEAGLEPRDDAAYGGFEHRVDRAITRDLVVATRSVSSSGAGAEARSAQRSALWGKLS
jgi:hypothetical protein